MSNKVMLMSFEQVQAVGVKKGSVVRFKNTNNVTSKWYEGVVVSKRVKNLSGGRYFCGARNRWIDAEPIKRLHIVIQQDGKDYTLNEDQFYALEVLK